MPREVKKINFKFDKKSIPFTLPTSYTTCILCDTQLKEHFLFDTSQLKLNSSNNTQSQRAMTQSSNSTQSRTIIQSSNNTQSQRTNNNSAYRSNLDNTGGNSSGYMSNTSAYQNTSSNSSMRRGTQQNSPMTYISNFKKFSSKFKSNSRYKIQLENKITDVQ